MIRTLLKNNAVNPMVTNLTSKPIKNLLLDPTSQKISIIKRSYSQPPQLKQKKAKT